MAKETKPEQKTQDEELEELADLPDEEETEEVSAEQPPTQEEAPTEEEAQEPEEAKPEEEEEAKPKRKKKEEEEIVEERFYTIPLQKALVRPPKKRSPRAMQLIKAFINKHMKVTAKVSEEEEEEELSRLIISEEVNEKVWGRGIEKPPRKIKVRATKDKDGNVTVYLAETQKQ
jgi:large subunit ribosomal protein L31e